MKWILDSIPMTVDPATANLFRLMEPVGAPFVLWPETVPAPPAAPRVGKPRPVPVVAAPRAVDTTAASSVLANLPDVALLRLRDILGDKRANPPVPPLIPVSKTSWWAGVKRGIYPAAVKLGPRTTAWRVADIRALIARLSSKPPVSR